MPKRIQCAEDSCTECSRIVVRVYKELRRAGYDGRAAFESAMRVLELRHPGHDRTYYQGRAAHWIASAPDA